MYGDSLFLARNVTLRILTAGAVVILLGLASPRIAVADHLEGHRLFTEKGCAACHGPNGEGGVGPALPGHTEAQVVRQVRTPRDKMPPFTRGQISDAELHEIVEYIFSLGPTTEGGHAHEEMEMIASPRSHTLMALAAIKGDNADDARHHVQHMIDFATDEATRSMGSKILELLQAENLHDAEHEIEEMLGTATEAPIHPKELHLQLAMDAMGIDKMDDARHHVQHAIDIASPEEKTALNGILSLLDSEQWHEAKHANGEILGPTAYSETMHLKDAAEALEHEDIVEARHHAIEAAAVAQAERKSQIEQLVAMLNSEDTHEAEEALARLLGHEPSSEAGHAEQPATLPKTGGSPLSPIIGALSIAGLAIVGTGLFVRRKVKA